MKRKNKMGDEIKRKLQEEEYTADSYNSWLESRPTSNLEKLHFIIGKLAEIFELLNIVYLYSSSFKQSNLLFNILDSNSDFIMLL